MDLSSTAFETPRLVVRSCTMSDAAALTNLMTPDISKWVAAWPTPITIGSTTAILSDTISAAASGAAFGGVVITKATGKTAGWCNLSIEGDQADLGYWIGENYQGHGYAFELSQGAIRFAFVVLKLQKLRAGAQVANSVSLALLQKLGMQGEGIEEVWAPARQRYEACEFWSLTAPAPRAPCTTTPDPPHDRSRRRHPRRPV